MQHKALNGLKIMEDDLDSPTGGLFITRRVGESLTIGPGILVRIVERHGNHVKLQIKAPKEVSILRDNVREDRPPLDHSEND